MHKTASKMGETIYLPNKFKMYLIIQQSNKQMLRQLFGNNGYKVYIPINHYHN